MILLHLNRTEYFNDICDEIRLFYPMEKIRTEIEENEEISIEIDIQITTDVLGKKTNTKAVCKDFIEDNEMELLENSKIYIKRIEKRNAKICIYRLLFHLTGISIPWGSLTGIRPTKLYRTLLENNSGEEADEVFRSLFYVTEQKIEVAKSIVNNQLPYIESTSENAIDIYIHIPFCNSKCLYCSFPSEIIKTSDDERLNVYLKSLYEDILQGYEIILEGKYHVRNIYIGGGTPSVLSSGQLDKLLTLLSRLYYKEDMEFTVEAGRPDSLDKEKFLVMKDYCVNRISINPQTMQEDTLIRLGRKHTPKEILSSYEIAKNVGFQTINMDLIAGLPGESLSDFSNTLNKVYDLDPQNLTIHTLAIKRSSKLHQYLESYQLPDEDTVMRMVETGYNTALKKGYMPYYMYRQKYMTGNLENIGYSKEGHICVYNIDMMEETTNILAHGANAMSKRVFPTESRVERIPNPKDLKTYIEKLTSTGTLKRKLFVDSLNV